MTPESLQVRADRLANTNWLGGPPRQFEDIGRMTFGVMLDQGLRPDSRVLDVGCGALRVGYWLMRFLDRSCYFGIEPQEAMLRVGLEQIVEPEVVERADAHFSHNEDFDFSVFQCPFDFVLARSIWSHASKSQISAMLRSFAENSSRSGIMLASYKPATAGALIGEALPPLQPLAARTALAALSPALASYLPTLVPDYRGAAWVGRDGESRVSGTVRHGFRWIAREADSHGLLARQLPAHVVSHQYWLRISHQ